MPKPKLTLPTVAEVVAVPYVSCALRREDNECCGVYSLVGVDDSIYLNRAPSPKLLVRHIVDYCFLQWSEPLAGWRGAFVVCTSTRPRPDLKLLGFKLAHKPETNHNSGNKIYMYVCSQVTLRATLRPYIVALLVKKK